MAMIHSNGGQGIARATRWRMRKVGKIELVPPAGFAYGPSGICGHRIRSPLGHFGVRQALSESEEDRTLRAAPTNPVLMPVGHVTTGLYERDCETSNRSY